MHWKSFLAGGAVVAIMASIVAAEQIAIPHQFASGTPALASEVNANFDVLVQESNAQDERIAAISGKIDELRAVEQIYCTQDRRQDREVLSELGFVVGRGFPTPYMRFTIADAFGEIVYTPAICVAPNGSIETFIETDAQQLANDGWRFIRIVSEQAGRPEFRSRTRIDGRFGDWYLFER